MRFYKKYLSVLFISVLLLTVPSVSWAENAGDVIILFDQSASMKDYDPKLISRAWMLTFIKIFEKPYDIYLTGFDDKLHQYAKVAMNNKKDMANLEKKIDAIKTRGLTTDMEVPLRYLLERHDRHPVALAVIISDGEPELWDEKRWYLSKRIRSDPRYEELNSQYRSLKTRGFTGKQLYDALNNRYRDRNLELINERLTELKKNIGGKLVFLDISGDFNLFKQWAKKTGAQYILAKALKEENPVESLRIAIAALQQKTIDILSEPLPAEHKKLIEPIPEIKQIEKVMSVAEPPPETEATPVTDIPEQSPAIQSKISVDDEQMSLIEKRAVIITLIVTVFILLLIYLFRYKKIIQSKSVLLDAGKEKASMSYNLEEAGNKLRKLSRSSIKETDKFIEKEIQDVISDAGDEELKLIEKGKNKFGFDKRGFLRIPISPGAMIVYWNNKNGGQNQGNAVNISMHGVFFEAAGFDGGNITRIECPAIDTIFHVKKSRIIRITDGRIVAALDEFENNIDERIKWVEILTRIDEVKE